MSDIIAVIESTGTATFAPGTTHGGFTASLDGSAPIIMTANVPATNLDGSPINDVNGVQIIYPYAVTFSNVAVGTGTVIFNQVEADLVTPYGVSVSESYTVVAPDVVLLVVATAKTIVQ